MSAIILSRNSLIEVILRSGTRDTCPGVRRHTLDHIIARGVLQLRRSRSVQCRLCRARNKRHAFATHLVEQGVDISIVQALLGHTHLSTTIRYISVATRTIAAVKSPLEHLRLTVPEMRPQQELTLSG